MFLGGTVQTLNPERAQQMESVTLFRLVMACLGGVSLAAALYQWWGERQQAFVSGACARALRGGGILPRISY